MLTWRWAEITGATDTPSYQCWEHEYSLWHLCRRTEPGSTCQPGCPSRPPPGTLRSYRTRSRRTRQSDCMASCWPAGTTDLASVQRPQCLDGTQANINSHSITSFHRHEQHQFPSQPHTQHQSSLQYSLTLYQPAIKSS